MPTTTNVSRGRLEARPVSFLNDQPAPAGTQLLGLDKNRDAILYVPESYTPGKPAPLAVMLHGAGGNAHHGLSLIQHLADAAGIIILAPFSRKSSWDMISSNRFDADVIFINQALEQVFARYAINPAFLAIGGFSDGASYALSIGLTNGDLFTHIIAFSPGFTFMHEVHGTPAIFISHGTEDGVLPIDVCSRRLVPKLQQAGYVPHYREFNGPHIIPADISRQAVDWFMA